MSYAIELSDSTRESAEKRSDQMYTFITVKRDRFSHFGEQYYMYPPPSAINPFAECIKKKIPMTWRKALGI